MAHFTSEEKSKLINAFEQLNQKPDFDDPEQLEAWLKNYGQGAIPKSQDSVNVFPQNPKISIFSGESKDTPFDLWKFEVQCLVEEGKYSDEALKQAIRKSLKNDPSRIVKRLGIKSTIDDIVKKLEGIYGEIEKKETIKAEFYNAKQEANESVTSWSCRLEEILDRLCEQEHIDDSEIDGMLRGKFYYGLLEHLKDKAAHKFDKDNSFDEFRTEVREIEHDYNQIHGNPSKLDKRSGHVKSAINKSDSSDYNQLYKSVKELTGAINGMRIKIENLEQKSVSDTVPTKQVHEFSQQIPTNNVSNSTLNPNSLPFHPSLRKRITSTNNLSYNGSDHNPSEFRVNPRFNAPQCQICFGFGHISVQCPSNQMQKDRGTSQCKNCGQLAHTGTNCGYTNLYRDTRQCWRCGQYGHISTSCAIRTDFMKTRGNFRGPLSGGRW